MPIIDINSVTKEYRLGQMTNLKESALNFFNRMRGKAFSNVQKFKALDDITFKVESGEVVGIIGTNGAGKSTILKILARVITPTKGKALVNGSVAPLIEVGAGLHPELTGRENIYLNGSILGISRQIIRKKFDEIVEFAELEEFINTPVKRYSSGMTIRLGFSIATAVDSDILIVDEVLAVGDLAFQRKCFDRMEDLIKRQGKTVLLVSHNIRQVERLCSRVILLDHGRILADDRPQQVCDLFYERSDAKIKKTISDSTGLNKINQKSTGDVKLLNIVMLDESGQQTDKIRYNADVVVSIKYKVNVPLIKPEFGIGIHTTDFLYLTTHHSEEQTNKMTILPGIYTLQCKIGRLPVLPGVYALRLGIAVGDAGTPIFYTENAFHFQVVLEGIKRRQAMREGFFALDAHWKVEKTTIH